MMVKSVKLVVAIAFLVSVVPVMANDMRCGQHYIEGDQMEPLTAEQVVEKCGEPTSKMESGQQWYYKGQGKILVFNSDGKLITIRDADQN